MGYQGTDFVEKGTINNDKKWPYMSEWGTDQLTLTLIISYY